MVKRELKALEFTNLYNNQSLQDTLYRSFANKMSIVITAYNLPQNSMRSHVIQATEYENFSCKKLLHICSGFSENLFVWAFFGSFWRINEHLNKCFRNSK